MNKRRRGIYELLFKRLLDFILSFIALIVLSPVLLVVAILVRLKLGSPVFFKQKRPGKNKKIFTMYKFRSMTNKKDENGELLPDSERLTRFGELLRSTSIDELPSLINIIKGDMSIVGPRPQLIKDMVFFDGNIIQRQIVRPGLTGLAQVNGRNDITWERKFALDIKYIERISFLKDMVIIIKTIFKVLKRSGINSSYMATSEDYGDYLLRVNRIDLNTYENKIAESKALQCLK